MTLPLHGNGGRQDLPVPFELAPACPEVNDDVVNLPGIRVGAVVVGHLLGVVSAHGRAVALFPRAKVLAGQLPLLVVMVGYTTGGPLLLFSQ